MSKVVEGDYGRALAFLADKLTNPDPVPEIPQRTFQSYLETEWAQYVRENWKQSTRTTQGSLVNKHISPYFFGEMLLSQIKPVTIEAFRAAMEDGSERAWVEDSETGNTCQSLAEKFGVGRQTICNVVNRVIWKGVAV